MDSQLVKQLRKLNNDFYINVAESFSKTRSSYWSGWLSIKKYIKEKDRILDLGCGNGRFLSFLKDNFNNFTYLGLDNNEKLISIAKNIESEKCKFENVDILNLENIQKLEQYDVIVLFGVLHHIPSKKLRISFLKEVKAKLNENGLLIISFWDLLTNKKLLKRSIKYSEELEEGDYIIDWLNDSNLKRYVHSFTEDEVKDIAKALDLKIIDCFRDDGKDKNSNIYAVLKNA